MTLKERIEKRLAKVSVVGLGYVGLPLATEAVQSGFTVIGLDVDKDRVLKINSGKSPCLDVSDSELQKLLNTGRLRASDDFGNLKEVECVLICVPTPLDRHNEPDISYVKDAATKIGENFGVRQKLVVLESTTYPGTTEEVIQVSLEKKGLRLEEDFYLAFSPERIDPGNRHFTIKNTPKIVGGVTKASTEVAEAFYKCILQEVVLVSSARTAEMTKLLENIFRVVNIALVNELLLLCERMGIDIWEVIRAARTKPFGFMSFYPGPGVGGHCIPVDPFYLSWKAKEFDFFTNFIELAAEINTAMPYVVCARIEKLLLRASRGKMPYRILGIGVSFKKDIPDTRNSPAIRVLEILLERGFQISYHDPYIERCKIKGQDFASVPLTPEVMGEFDLTAILTDHSSVDWKAVVRSSNLVFDARNVTAGMECERVVRLGVRSLY